VVDAIYNDSESDSDSHSEQLPPAVMDSIIRQSKAMCPFLKSASPSTSARPKPSPCGGAMSKLQLLAHRCPVMGKAMAVQSSKYGAAAGLRAMSSQPKSSRAHIHTSRNQEARAVDSPVIQGRENGK
jgi:5-aminolevulinate synthase